MKNSVTQAKIVYLFGAGATHAELVNLYPEKITDPIFLKKNGLLMGDVSKRVCIRAKDEKYFSKRTLKLFSSAGLSNIELFISLLEKNEIKSDEIIERLKELIKKDILKRLTPSNRKKFYLHKSLFEFHLKKKKREKLLGIISLNYDQVLDDAYRTIIRKDPNYCLSLEEPKEIPLLKLHGGFGLPYRGKELPIITPGINKNYLELPYNFIWGRALELLIECDILRVIGCSLSQNDLGLIDLLFKAHLAREQSLKIQMITFDPKNNNIKENYGFFPDIETAFKIEGDLISDPTIDDPSKGSNPFQVWLKAKFERMMTHSEIIKTKYVKKVLV